MINYFLKVTICWSLFYLIYQLFLSKETFFKINRWYLLGTLLVGLVIPIIPLNVMAWFPQQPTAAIYIEPIIEPIVESVQRVDTVISVQTAKEEVRYGLLLFWFIYAVGVLICLGRFGKGLWKIYRLYQSAEVHQKGNYKLVLTNQSHLPFSFFSYLFWSQGTHIEDKDAGTIITHEVAHINQWHSLDTLFLEWLSIFLWFSPPIYWYKKSLKDIHEYLADAYVLKDTKTKQYGHLLLKQAQSGMQLALASHFLDSQLKKRILMMTKNQSSNQALMKYLSALPLLVLMVMVFSNPQVRSNLNATAQLSLDYLNPHVIVPNVSPSLLFWIGGDFDREKARKVLEEAYKCEGSQIMRTTYLDSGEERTFFTSGDHIKELHKAVIFLIQKFPAYETEIHELVVEIGKENGYALRFHENGESIIYREIPSKKDKAIANSKEKLILFNDEIFGYLPEGLQGTPAKDIKFVEEIPPHIAITQYGDLGKNGAVKFYSDHWYMTELNGKKQIIPANPRPPLPDNHLVLVNDTIVGFAPEVLEGIRSFKSSPIIYMDSEAAIGKYGEELGKYGSKNYITDELTVEIENGKKVIKRVADILTVPTSSEKRLLIVNNLPVYEELFSLSSIPTHWVQEFGELSKEDLFMRGIKMSNQYEKAIYVTLKEQYSIIKDKWGKIKILPKVDFLSSHYTDDRKLFVKVDQMPTLKSCSNEATYSEQEYCSYKTLNKYIYTNIKYPPLAREAGIEGTIRIQFTVELDGTISKPFIAKSVVGLDEEVMRLFNQMSAEGIRWIPGRQNGEDVRVVLNKPIEFRMEDDKLFTINPHFDLSDPISPKSQKLKEGLQNHFEETEKMLNKELLKTSITLIPETDYTQLKEVNEESKLNSDFFQDPFLDQEKLQVNISPNPAHENISLTIKGAAMPIFISVTDLVGRQIYEQKLVDFNGNSYETILFEESIKGMVIVTVSQGGHSRQEKVMVQ